MYLSTGSCKFLQTVVTDNFFANSWFGIFLQFITIAILDKLFASFASWGFQTNLQGGRGGQVGQGEHLTGFMLYSMLHVNREFFRIWFPFNPRERNASVAVEFATRHTPLRSLSQLSKLENFFILCISISLVCKDFLFYPRPVLLLLRPKKLDLTCCLI